MPFTSAQALRNFVGWSQFSDYRIEHGILSLNTLDDRIINIWANLFVHMSWFKLNNLGPGGRRPDTWEPHLNINASSSSEICVLPGHTTTKRSRAARAHGDEALSKGGWVTVWRCVPILFLIAVGTSRRGSQRYRGMRNILATNLVCGTQMIPFIAHKWYPLLHTNDTLHFLNMYMGPTFKPWSSSA